MLTLQSRVKDVTCTGILCEHANSHGARDFTGGTELQAEFRNVTSRKSMFNLCMFKVAKQFICSVDTYTHEGWIALNIYQCVFKNYLLLKSVLSYTITSN